MIPKNLKNLLELINQDFLVLLIILVSFILIIIQIIIIKKLNFLHEIQKTQVPYLANIDNLVASLRTSDENISQSYEEMAVELKSNLIVNAVHREIVLQNFNEIQDMIEDVKHELITKEISRHRLNKLISTTFKESK